MSTVQRISVSIYQPLIDQIEERGEARSTIISRDLERLYTLYQRALRRVDLTIDEACLVVDALNSSLMTADTAHLLWAGIEDAIQHENLAEKWGVDGQALVEKLRSLNEVQSMAVIDAAERFWSQQKYRDQDMREAVAECFEQDSSFSSVEENDKELRK